MSIVDTQAKKHIVEVLQPNYFSHETGNWSNDLYHQSLRSLPQDVRDRLEDILDAFIMRPDGDKFIHKIQGGELTVEDLNDL